MTWMRSTFAFAAVALLGGSGCYADPAYSQSTLPPEPVYGPPGGGADPGSYYQQPAQYPQDPNGYNGYADPNAQQGYADPNDPNAQGYVDPNAMGPVTDTEIDATLDGYGTWEEDPDYGRIWRPDVTTVGVDFTPYSTCGSWVWTDYGWTYSCDAWGWGWLPFHYGRWGWFDGYWGWVPGYEWGPGWVDWRSGGGYVGWRPMGPIVRDHRGGGWDVRDHRHTAQMLDSHWRFTAQGDLGRPNIHSHIVNRPAEGPRVKQPVTRPPGSNVHPTAAASLMRPRIQGAHVATGNPTGGVRQPLGRNEAQPRPTTNNPGWQQPQGARQPAWRQPVQTYRPPVQSYRQPQQTYRAPQQTYRPPVQTYRAPEQGYRAPQQTWRAPQQTYRAPQQSYRAPQQTYRAPQQSYRAPVYSAPSHSYSAPSHSYSAPSHSYSAPSHSYSAPSHSFSGGGGGHSYGGGGGGHFGGGGGRHR